MSSLPFFRPADVENNVDRAFFDALTQLFNGDLFDGREGQIRHVPRDVPLRIDNGGFRTGPNQIWSVRKTSQVKLAEMHPRILTLIGNLQHPVQSDARIGGDIRRDCDLIGHTALEKTLE